MNPSILSPYRLNLSNTTTVKGHQIICRHFIYIDDMARINVLDKDVAFYTKDDEDYICITDIARYKDSRTDDIIKNWLRNRNTIEFLGIWETINNPDFNPVEFDGFRKRSGLSSFVLTAKQ